MSWQEEAMGYVGKIISGVMITIVGIWLFGALISLISDGPKKQTPTGGNVWKNWDPSRTAQDVKSYNYNTQTVTYREYRSDPSPSCNVPTKTVEKREVIWSWSPKKKSKITVDNGKMEIPVQIDLEELMRNLPESDKQDFVQSVMDDMDYNDLLDYYGSPELR